MSLHRVSACSEKSTDTVSDQQLIAAEHFLKQSLAASGLLYMKNGNSVPLSVAVLPALLPSACHHFALDTLSHWLTLVNRLSTDDRFLTSTLDRVAAVDYWVERQMHVYRETCQQQTSIRDQLSLCLLRIDYMQSSSDDEMKLIEISSTYAMTAGCSTKLTHLHARLWESSKVNDSSTLLVHADAAQVFADGLAAAYEHYQMRCGSEERRALPVILVVLNDDDLSDLAVIEESISKPISVIHRRIEQVTRDCRVSDSGILFIGSLEVAVVYFFVSMQSLKGHWDTRLLLERSLAVKCPSMRQSLIGLKTVQQALSEPNVIERYAPNVTAGQQLRRTMVGQFALSDRLAVQRALVQPHRFVLKPNRDGGGHNFFDDALRVKLESIVDQPEADAYILMERIVPPKQRNVLLFGQSSFSGETDNEFCYYGVVLTTGTGEVLYQKAACQPASKIKPAECDEGGIAAGYGALGTVAIV